MEAWAAYALLLLLLALGAGLLVVARCIKPKQANRPGGPLQLQDVLGADFEASETPWEVDLLNELVLRVQLSHPHDAPTLAAVEDDLAVAVDREQDNLSPEMINSFETNVTELRWLTQHVYENAIQFKEGQALLEQKEMANEIRFFIRILERRVIRALALSTAQLSDAIRKTFAPQGLDTRDTCEMVLTDYKPLVSALQESSDHLKLLASGDLGGCELDDAAEAAKALPSKFNAMFGKRYDNKTKKWVYDHTSIRGVTPDVKDSDLTKREKLNDLKQLEKQVKIPWGKHIDRVSQCLNDFLFEEVLVTEERGSLLQEKEVRRFTEFGARFSWAFRAGRVSDFDPVGGLYSIDWHGGPFAGTITDVTWFELRYILLDIPAEVVEKPPDDEIYLTLDMVLWKYFMAYDLDKSGFIDDEREIHAVCTHVIYQQKVKLKADIIKERCLTADDCLNYEEFRTWFLEAFPETADDARVSVPR
jgi:hypothetical protein